MIIKTLNELMIDEVISLWNNNKDDLYVSYTKETFTNNFINNEFFKYEGSKVIIIDEKIIDDGLELPAFASIPIIDVGKSCTLEQLIAISIIIGKVIVFLFLLSSNVLLSSIVSFINVL